MAADKEGVDWIFIIAAVVGAWVLVSLTGYERQRRVEAIAPPTPPAQLPLPFDPADEHDVATAGSHSARKAA